MADMTSAIASGLNSLMNEYNSVSHNLANSSTAGYKRRVTTFSTQMQSVMDGNMSPLAGGIESEDLTDFSQGMLKQTDRPLDIAIDGDGFLTLETAQGRLYSRNGSLQVNILGQLTDLNGHLVAGRNGAITIPKSVNVNDIQINADGVISAGQNQLGTLEIVQFDKPAADLEPVGNGCYQAGPDRDPKPAENASVRQGYQEQSNDNAVGELTNLLSISRMFEANINYLKKQSQNSSALIEVANS